MEMFMIMTGFYEVATRKEAERRAMIEWELEDNGTDPFPPPVPCCPPRK